MTTGKIKYPNIEEEWKPLYKYKYYEISNFGNIRSLDRLVDCTQYPSGKRFTRGKVLKLRTNGVHPQLFCGISDLSKSKCSITIHSAKAMMDHFKPKPSKKYKYVIPIDGDHTNIHPNNYKWITASESIKNQPKRKEDPTKAWKTRKSKYGRRGTYILKDKILEKRISSLPVFHVKIPTKLIIEPKQNINLVNDIRKEDLIVEIKGKYTLVKGLKTKIYYSFLRKFNIAGYSRKITKI